MGIRATGWNFRLRISDWRVRLLLVLSLVYKHTLLYCYVIHTWNRFIYLARQAVKYNSPRPPASVVHIQIHVNDLASCINILVRWFDELETELSSLVLELTWSRRSRMYCIVPIRYWGFCNFGTGRVYN